MNDRELLELAAKAAGYNIAKSSAQDYAIWNPLTDDGDALRLAVKLQIDMGFYAENGSTSLVLAKNWCCRNMIGRDDVEPKGDIYTATRRAIVRAAAEIGKGIEVAAEAIRKGE